MNRKFLFFGMLVVSLLAGSSLSASEIYLGNVSGTSFSSSNRADSAPNLTYIFSTNPYAPSVATQVELDQVNFFTGSGGAGQTVTPFVALYNGGDVSSGASFSLLQTGDPIVAVSGINNDQFTVGGVNPTVTVPAGEQLVSGLYQTGEVVYFDAGTVGDVDIFSGNKIPGSVGGTFPAGHDYDFNFQKYYFDIGLHTVPEPATAMMLSIGGLACLSRRRV